MPKPYLNDPAIQIAAEDAARAACLTLDETFTGGKEAGITGDFQILLKDVVLHMLAGRSPLKGRRGHAAALPKLVLTDADFGDPFQRGDAFVVAESGAEEAYVLNGCETAFVPLEAHSVDPYPSFAAAVAGALRYGKPRDPEAPLPAVRPVRHTDAGWRYL